MAITTCSVCGQERTLSEMRKRPPLKDGTPRYGPNCNPCNAAAARRWARENRARVTERRRIAEMPKLYGITAEQYDLLLAKQGGVCAICGQDELNEHGRTGRKFRLSVDHCHLTGRVRGLLCQKCNRAIGLLNDDIGLLEAAIGYLKRGSGSD